MSERCETLCGLKAAIVQTLGMSDDCGLLNRQTATALGNLNQNCSEDGKKQQGKELHSFSLLLLFPRYLPMAIIRGRIG